jgi:hypothetical protein
LPLGPHWSNEIISKWLFSCTTADHTISHEEIKEMRVGVWFYGLATVVTGILDLVWGVFEASHQPIQSLGHFSGEHVLAYLAGVWLVAARTGGGSGIGRDLPYLCLVLGASVVCFDS